MSNPKDKNQEKRDVTFMKRVLKLAERGRGYVSPNPMVGALVIKDGEVVGEGFHEKYGQAHAEVNAINNAGDAVAGSTIYVNLEPCAHKGKTGPCTEKIVEAGISRVVIGMKDPNPIVNGKGVKYLRSKGITVTEQVLEDKCFELNQAYVKYISTGNPFLTIKIAQTLDARIATSTGNSKWITAQDTRVCAHRLRAEHDAILAGIGTILTDDPKLTTRYVKGKSPKRIVLDSQLRIPLDANVLTAELASGTTIVTTDVSSKEKITRIEEKGAKVLVLEADSRGWVPQNVLWPTLGKMGITSILIEGGSSVQTECIKGRNADRVVIFMAPKILGTGIDAIGDLGIRNINAAIELENLTVKMINHGDLMISANFKHQE